MILVAAVAAELPVKPPVAAATEDGIRVYFSPDGGAGEAIIHEIERATSTLDIAAYTYTHPKIAKATVEAHKRGVKVRVLLDRTQSGGKYSSSTFLHNAGVPVWIDAKDGGQHNKYLIIDGETIITGSFNLTKAADETNAENLLILENKPKLLDAYSSDYNALLRGAKPYEGPKAATNSAEHDR